MWAQLVKARVKPGQEEAIRGLPQEFEAQGGNSNMGPTRVFMLQNQNDPQEYYTLIFFESEEKARENEGSPEQEQRLQHLRDLYEGAPEYVDLIPIHEWSR